MGLFFGRKKYKYDDDIKEFTPEEELAYTAENWSKSYDKYFDTYMRIAIKGRGLNDIRPDKKMPEIEMKEFLFNYENHNGFSEDYKNVVFAEKMLSVDEDGNSTHPEIYADRETPEVYEKRMQYTRIIGDHIRGVMSKNGDDPSLNGYEMVFHKYYYHKAIQSKREADFTNKDYQIIRNSIDVYYKNYNGLNHCIITPDYAIEAWLMLAQYVFYDSNNDVPEDIKVLSCDVGLLNIRDKISFSATEDYEFHYPEEDNPHPGFEFKILDPTDTEYRKQLEDYVQKTYGCDFRKFDTTFSLGTAKMIINDVINNGIDRGFTTYDVQEKELMQILKIRSDRKLTKAEFLELSDYGKELVVKEAIRNNIGIMAYPIPAEFDTEKLISDVKTIATESIRRELHLTNAEMRKNVNIRMETNNGRHTKNEVKYGIHNYFKEDLELFRNRYFLYYYDANNKPHRLNSLFKDDTRTRKLNEAINNNTVDWTQYRSKDTWYDSICYNIMSLKEMEYRFLSRRLAVNIPYSKAIKEQGASSLYKQNPDTGNVIPYLKHPSYNSMILQNNNIDENTGEPTMWTRGNMGEGCVQYVEGGMGGFIDESKHKYDRKDYCGHDEEHYTKTIQSCMKDLSAPFSIFNYINESPIYEDLIKCHKIADGNFKDKIVYIPDDRKKDIDKDINNPAGLEYEAIDNIIDR